MARALNGGWREGAWASASGLAGKVDGRHGRAGASAAAIAETMAGLGAKVVISSRKADACEAVAKEIRRAAARLRRSPATSRARRGEALIVERRAPYGKIDISSAMPQSIRRRPLGQLSDEAFDKIWAPCQSNSGSAISRSRQWPSAAAAA